MSFFAPIHLSSPQHFRTNQKGLLLAVNWGECNLIKDEKRIAFTRSGLNRVRSRSYNERNVSFCLNYNLKEVLTDH